MPNLSFFCGHEHFPQISTNSFVVVVGSWELQNQHSTQWEFKTGFVKHPRMFIILSLFLFHTHMLSLLHGKPPHPCSQGLPWFEISYLRLMCDIKSFSKGLLKEQKGIWWYLPKSLRIVITTYETQSGILATILFAIDSKYTVHLVSLFLTIKILEYSIWVLGPLFLKSIYIIA